LPLEGAILAADGFGIGALKPEELVYLRLSGAAEAGKLTVIDGDAEVLATQAAEKLAKRILQFCDPAQGYAPRVAPFHSNIAGDYDHLARVREWSSGWSDE